MKQFKSRIEDYSLYPDCEIETPASNKKNQGYLQEELTPSLSKKKILQHVLVISKSEEAKKKPKTVRDFPGGTVVKNPPASAGDMGSIPGLGRSHMLRSN